MNSSHPTFIGLGTNLGGRNENLRGARKLLSQRCERLVASSIIETEPVGIESNLNFLNQVVRMENPDFPGPQSLLKYLLASEKKLGRDREKTGGDRIIDLDLLYYGDSIRVGHPTVPHPRLHKRQFVLIPLVEIAPDFLHPIFNKTQKTLLERVQQHG